MKLHLRALFAVLWLVFPAVIVGQSSAGKEFVMSFMQNSNSIADDELRLLITSTSPTFGQVQATNGLWSDSFYCSPDEPASLIIPASVGEVTSSQVIEQKSIRITSDEAIEVSAMNYSSSTADATRILPVDAIGVSYVIAAYNGSPSGSSQMLIVSAFDDTEIIITPASATSNGNPANIPFVITLDAGECYQVHASGNADLTGTLVQGTTQSGSCRRFAVFSGASCANVPVSCGSACDHLFEQNIPVTQWGKHYVVTPPVFDPDPDYGVTDPAYTYRILAAENGTNVSIDGVASFVLSAGEFQEYNGQTTPHCIESNAPVAVIQYLEGISCGGNGDPSLIILESTDAPSGSAAFVIEDIGTLVHHFLNIVIPAESLGDLLLDGLPIPSNDFVVLPSCSDWLWYGEEIDPGAHRLSSLSDDGFVAMIYGHGAQDSGVSESYATMIGGNDFRQQIVPDAFFCTQNSLSIEVPEGYSNAQWFNADDVSVVISDDDPLVISSPTGSELYLLYASSDASGCVDTFYYSVESPLPISLSIESETSVICEHDVLLLTAQMNVPMGNYDFIWTASTAEQVVADDYVAEVSPAVTTDYFLNVISPGGCSSANASTTVTVNEGSVAAYYFEDQYMKLCEGNTAQPELIADKKIWSDNFNPAISWGDWQNIFGGSEAITCGSVSGNSLYFNGTFPREAITQPMDLSLGGHIYFSLKIANGAAPCDNAEPGDNVVLSYSVANGPWNNIQTFYESSYPDFTEVIVDIPPGAMSNDVRLRWRQSGSYTTNQDNWVLDDIYVGVQDLSDFEFEWTPASGVVNVNDPASAIAPDESGWFALQMNDPTSGCVYSDSVFIELSEPFNLQLTPDTADCSEAGVMLQALPDEPGDYTYSWTPALTLMGAQTSQPVANPVANTSYHVVVSSDAGCVAEGDVQVSTGVDLQFQISVNDSAICVGEQIFLSALASPANESYIFNWSGDASLSDVSVQNPVAMPLSPEFYTCTVVHSESGCSASDTLEVLVFPSFTIDPTPDEVIACSVTDIVVSASPSVVQNYTWQWSPADMVVDPTAQTTSIVGEQSGSLMISATSDAGCIASAEIQVSVSGPVTDLGADIAACADEPIVLDTGWPANYNILWSTGETTPSIIITESGIYDVVVEDPNGCLSQDSVNVVLYDYPVVELGADTVLCEGSVMTLVAGQPGWNYTWNTGSIGSSILITEGGQYEVEVDNGFCVTYDDILVSFQPLPQQPFEPEIDFCFGIDPNGFILDAQNQGSTYLWQNDSSTVRYIQVVSGGEYSVTVTDEQCSATFTTFIEEVCPYSIYAPNSFTPDGDGVNDFWFVYGQNITGYHLRLYNRLGELFFESVDINQTWLGQRRNGDTYVEPGVYDYQITFQVIDEDGNPGDTKVVTGFVVLIR